MNALLLTVGACAALVLLVLLAVVRRIKVAGPNQAFLVTGRRGRAVHDADTGLVSTDMSGQKVVMGASVFVLPFVQRLHVMDLSSRRLQVRIHGAVSATGITCDLEGVAIVKVAGSEDMVRAAAQRFLDQQQGIEVFTQEVLAGSLRSIVGRLTVEEIIKDRAAFASEVAEEAEASLTNQGLQLDTFQLQDIQAEGSYLVDLGRPEAARVAKEADIAEARARQVAEQEALLAEEAVAVAQRTLALRRAQIQAETDAAQAEADSAGPLAAAARDQMVLVEQERVAQKQSALRESDLDTEVRKPADAARYRVEQEAEAAKNAAIARAEADRLGTVAAAQAELARRTALAEAVRLEGEAEASAIEARGEAEGRALQARAEAFGTYGEAAVLELLLNVLPKVVREASAPLAAVDKLTVISTDGASSLTRTVAGGVEQGLQLTRDLTGVDLAALLGRVADAPRPAVVPAAAGA